MKTELPIHPTVISPDFHHQWFPACGGTEVPFKTRSGKVLHYMWCPSTGQHAYYNCTDDVFLTDSEAHQLLPLGLNRNPKPHPQRRFVSRKKTQ